MLDRVAAVVGRDDVHARARSSTVVRAKMLRMSSSTISTFLPASTVVGSCRSLEHLRAASRGSLASVAVQEAAPSGRAAAPASARRLTRARSAQPLRAALVVRRQRRRRRRRSTGRRRERGSRSSSSMQVAAVGMSGRSRVERPRSRTARSASAASASRRVATRGRPRRRRRRAAATIAARSAVVGLDDQQRRAAAARRTRCSASSSLVEHVLGLDRLGEERRCAPERERRARAPRRSR